MIDRTDYLKQLATTVRRSPVTALVGPRQCGKTTLAREFAAGRKATLFDLESVPDRQRLQNPELMLGSLKGLVVLDEIQCMPELFNVLRVLVDRSASTTRFLLLGSASPDLIKGVSETLAGRVQFVELAGFYLAEAGTNSLDVLWQRGGFPRSFLAKSDSDSVAWRNGFIQTFLERDIPQLGITLAAPAMRRFWTMLAHYHGQIWNASELGRSMSLTDKTVRAWLDILTGTFMVRQLQPWFVNVGKRQVKSPKVYVRDTGLLHSLLNLVDRHALLGHPQVGASWEGFVVEQVLRAVRPAEAYYWATHQGAELDLLIPHRGRSYGIEIKFTEAPTATKSMRIVIDDLSLKHLWIIHPGTERYPIDKQITAWPLRDIERLRGNWR